MLVPAPVNPMSEKGSALTESLLAMGIGFGMLGGILVLFFCSGVRHQLDFLMYEALLCRFENTSLSLCNSQFKTKLEVALPKNAKFTNSWNETKTRKSLKLTLQTPIAKFNFKKSLFQSDIPFFAIANPDPKTFSPRPNPRGRSL